MRLFWLILLLTGHALSAQYTSKLGRFSIEYGEGCDPVTIHVSRHDSFGNISRQYIYEDGLITTTDTFYTYSTAGTYTIVQYLGEDIDPKSDTLIFTVYEPKVPEYHIVQCSETAITVLFSDDYYDYYTVWFTETDSVVYRSSDTYPSFDYGTNSGTVNVKGFFDDAFTNCGSKNTSFNLTSIPDVVISDINLQQACTDSIYVEITLESVSDINEYQFAFIQDNEEQTLFTGVVTENPLTFPVTVNNEVTEYCVEARIMDPCSNTVSKNDQLCKTLQTQSINLDDAYASYSGDKVLIYLDSLATRLVTIYRKPYESGAFSELTETRSSYLDAVPSQLRPYEYRLVSTDTCGYMTDSTYVMAPFVKFTDINARKNLIYLEETSPENDLGGSVESIIYYSEDSTQTDESGYSAERELPAGIGSVIHLRLQYAYDAATIYSNALSTEYNYIVGVPSAFTPNHDGLNDELELFGLPTNEFKILIFDRWGSVIHVSTENPVWDGRKANKKVEEGTYTYKLSFTLEDGSVKNQIGSFTLLKN